MKIHSWIAAVSALILGPAAHAQDVPFLVTPGERGVILRWVWGEGERPAGYFVERRMSSTSPWVRLTPQPLVRIRDRAVVRQQLGDAYDRYEGLLFPANPTAERADPETFRGMQLLSADLEPGVARVLGLRYDDVGAANATAHEYRLLALTSSGERVLATSDAVIAGGHRPPEGPRGVVAGSAGKGTSLRWATSARFSGYNVYRGARRDGSDARQLNDAPVIVFSREDGVTLQASTSIFTDTAPPRDSAFYRVEGIDAFGRPSQRSPAVSHLWRSTNALSAPTLPQTRIQRDTIVVTWQPSSDARVTSYQLWRAPSDTGPYVRVGTRVRAREQREIGRPAGRVHWYRVTGFDDAGQESDASAPALAEIPDLVPPPVPDSLIGIADTGRLTIRWRQVPAPDLRGYRVYRAIAPGGTYALLSAEPTRTSGHVDTIPRRADHPFYYRVTAVDSAFNESAPSAVVTVRPPDGTPPSAPKIGAVRTLNDALAVTWLANPEPDVTGYRLRFRVKGEPVWRVAPTDRPMALSDTITGLVAGNTYELSVVAVDDAANQSMPSGTIEARPARSRAVDRADIRGGQFVARERGVVLWWSPPSSDVVEALVLRRDAGGSQPFRPLAAVPVQTTRFVDRMAKAGARYEYVVQLRDGAGNVSDSKPRRVQVPEAGGSR